MYKLSLERLNSAAAKNITPFLSEVLDLYREKIHSIHVTGTAVTEDFNIKTSDINSIFVLKEMDLKFLEIIAPLGKKYSKDKIAAPLIMTPEYIIKSVDVFPVEFLNFKLIHSAVYGDDAFENIEIKRVDLRQQCERELKSRLIWLRQGYISRLGDMKALSEDFVNSIAGYIPLFRAIMTLLGKQPPVRQHEVITAVSQSANINTDAFMKILRKKRGEIKFSKEDLSAIFTDYYTAIEKLGKIVDEI
ncbi:MAG: hypothetical protein HY806_01780 [Nitrospirae bacterium]|nr:hypothetical protein [Nitrospirota bacterium]